MKKIIYIAAVMALAGLSSCNRPSELPPLDTNYDKSFVLPEPEILSIEDRKEIEKLRQEYNEATQNAQQE